MTIVAARHGYAEASVARVVKQAGMSRATFYEHFEDRDDCFRAAFAEAALAIRTGLDPARWAPARIEPRAVLGRVLTMAQEHPASSALVLVESLAGDGAVRVQREELLDEIEVLLGRYLSAYEEAIPLEIPVRALLGGIGNLIGTRLFRREAGDLTDLLDDLLVWLGSYALSPGRSRMSTRDWLDLGRAWEESRQQQPPAPREERSLPRGRSALPPGQVASEHRERIVEAISSCARANGYAETTVADIVAAAGITRAAFYEQFRSKEDAFLAAQGLGLERSAAAAAASFFSDGPWPERVWSSAEALVGFLTDNLDLAYSNIIESYAVGPAAIRRAFDSRMAYTLFLEDGYRQLPEPEALPRICGEAISGAIEEMLRRQVVNGRTERAQELVPAAVYVTLAPFIGAEEALEFVLAACRDGGP